MGTTQKNVAISVIEYANSFLEPLNIALAYENGEVMILYHHTTPRFLVYLALRLALKRAQRDLAQQFA